MRSERITIEMVGAEYPVHLTDTGRMWIAQTYGADAPWSAGDTQTEALEGLRRQLKLIARRRVRMLGEAA